MAKTKVFFSRLGQDDFRGLLESSGILEKLSGNAAVKLHMGEAYSKYTVAPEYVSVALSVLKANGTKPFLTDTTALYHGTRSTEKDYLKTAAGRGYASLGAPVVIADGDGDIDVPMKAKNGKTIFLAKKILEATSMLVLSHCKGHVSAGFGGAIKNLAMGCASKAGKRAMHEFPKPLFSKEKCTGCGDCFRSCPVNAITVVGENKKASASDRCITCGACLRICRQGAVSFPGCGDPAAELQKRLAGYALALVKSLEGKIAYVNFLNNVSRYCDCMKPSEIIAKDVGILASLDPVAIDHASYEMLSPALERTTGIDGSVQIKAAEELGLGSRNYELVTV